MKKSYLFLLSIVMIIFSSCGKYEVVIREKSSSNTSSNEEKVDEKSSSNASSTKEKPSSKTSSSEEELTEEEIEKALHDANYYARLSYNVVNEILANNETKGITVETSLSDEYFPCGLSTGIDLEGEKPSAYGDATIYRLCKESDKKVKGLVIILS